MALGFQDCCNIYSFFYLDETPGYVSEFEVYHIITSQGETFCGRYRDVPPLNYSPPTYTLVEMTQFTNCDDCLLSFPCPTEEIILTTQFIEGSVASGVDCEFTTIIPMEVEPVLVNPTEFDSFDGQIGFNIFGGTQPYIFINTLTSEVLPFTQNGDFYSVYSNVGEGSYFITVVDSTGDFSVSAEYFLDAPPSPPTVICNPTNASFFAANDGQINLNISEGTPPYLVIYQGNAVVLPLTGLLAGTYTLQVIDQNFTVDVECEVTEPGEIQFPNQLCLSFTYCTNIFEMSFVRVATLYNFRPTYNAVYPQLFGLNQLTIRYDISLNRWETTTETSSVSGIQYQTPPGNCNIGSNQFKMLGPLAVQPTGPWNGGPGMLAGINGTLTSGLCVPRVTLVSTSPYCAGPPAQLGTAILTAAGGSGPPYVFSYSSNGVTYTDSPIPTLSLVNGSYTARIRDSLGTFSSPINFTITSENNTFNNSQITKCGIVDFATLSGKLDGPVDRGEFRQFDSEFTYYYEFNGLPDGVSLTADLNLSVNQTIEITNATDYANVYDWCEFEVKVLQCLIINGSNQIDRTNNFISSASCPATNSTAQVGSTTVGAVNYGNFCSDGTISDLCDGPNGEVTFRTSPNKFQSCNSTYSFASFKEGDLNGKLFRNNHSMKTEAVPINNQTKIVLKLKFRQRNEMSFYYPPIIYETDNTTINNPYVPAVVINALDQPNAAPLKAVGGISSNRVVIQMQKITITQQPSSCFSPPPGAILDSISNVAGQTTGISMEMNNSFSTTQPSNNFEFRFAAREVNRRNAFFNNINTCTAPPSWAP
jgi:hypothetical protein